MSANESLNVGESNTNATTTGVTRSAQPVKKFIITRSVGSTMSANESLNVGESNTNATTTGVTRSAQPVKKSELKHPAAKNWLIHLHYIRREFETCKSIIFEELQRTNGNSEYPNYVLSLIYRSEGKMQESLDKLQVCHELEPTNANTIKQIARSLFLLGRHKLAIDAYKKAHLLNEDSDSETYYNMGMCYTFMRDLDKAKEHMNLSLQARVSHEAFEALAQIALAKKNIPEAIIVYEKAARIFPENSDILSSLGLLYMKVGRDDVSFARLGSALAFDPNNSKALVAMASMMQTHEDYDNALAKYKGAMDSLPDSASVWNNTGMCFYFGKKKYVAAISCLKRAYYLSPFDWKILHNLGLIHLHMQQYASAFHFLTASINLKPEQSHNFMLLGVAISHLDDLDYARHSYEQALRLNAEAINTDPTILWLNYGISLFNHQQYEEAHQKFMQVHVLLSKTQKGVIDPDVRSTFTRVKTMMKLFDYKFPEDGGSGEPEIMPAPIYAETADAPLSGTSGSTSTKLRAEEKPLISKQPIDVIDEADLV